jgi:hypothetical protein
LNKLYIDAGLNALDGHVKVFGPPFEVCFECSINPELKYEEWKRYSCLKLKSRNKNDIIAPTAPTISSMMAGMQVQLATKYLHKISIPVGYRFTYNDNLDEMEKIKLSRLENCVTHNIYEQISDNNIKVIKVDLTKMSLNQLVNKIKQNINREFQIELSYDIILSLYCNRCQNREYVLKRIGELYVDEVECPVCKKNKIKGADLLRKQEIRNYFVSDELFGNKMLSECGFINFDIIQIKYRDEKDYRKVYYQFNAVKGG